jgi:hypothetical protein
MSKAKYYLKINLPPNFDEADTDNIKNDLMAYINSKNQYGALYGLESLNKGITITKVIYQTNENSY